jgi:hypothetical protein
MLRELSLPAGALREEHRQLEEHFVAALEPQMTLLQKSAGKGKGEVHFVLRHLSARVIGDLIVVLHLATHGYLTQAYNNLRASYETLDLLDLVFEKPEEAGRWVNTDNGHVEFRPGEVRKRLGRPPFDEVYGQFSEFAHPRFAGSRISAIGKRPADTDEELRVEIQVGPFFLDEMPDHWLLLLFLPLLIGRLMRVSAGLIGLGEVKEDDWDRSVVETASSLSQMSQLINGQLEEHGVDTSDLNDFFANVGAIVDESNAAFPSADPRTEA